MNLVHPPRPRDVFHLALERPRAEREAFVASACVDNSAMQVEVHELLDAFDQAEHALEPVATQTVVSEDGNRLVGMRIGSYHIRRLIAAGGMGAVYEATQDQPRRAIALKLMRQGIASRSALRRFEYESQILGRLRHPGIAQIYEAGTHDLGAGTGAIPYFAMEYIPEARTLIEYAADQKLGTRARLQLFATVCEAVHHGHQKGVIHRDLKPSNILVDAAGQAKIIDFGVARATDSDIAVTTLQTDVGQLIGTLQYMSPEQCAADPHDIDTRSDVYALGVILYELLCERLPYDLSHVVISEATRVIREQAPPKPSGINRALRGDVETIVLRALEKERSRRYQSAGDLGEDITRYLRNEPIQARPPSLMYQVRVFARRNRAVFVAASALLIVLVLAVIVTSVMWAVTAQANREKETARQEATQFFSDQLTLSVRLADRRGNREIARALIAEAAKSSEDRFVDQPDAQVMVHQALGGSYQEIGEFTQALAEFSRAREIGTQSLGADHVRTITAVASLASLCRDMADHEQAEPLYRSVIEAVRRSQPESEWDGARWSDLADMLHDLGRCDEAEALAREALEISMRRTGGSIAGSAFYIVRLAGVCRDQGRHHEAEELLTDLLHDCEREWPEGHEDAYRTQRELARLYLVQGRFDEALALQKRALQGHTRAFADGLDNPDLLLTIELGALIDRAENRLPEAEQTLAEIAQRAKQRLGAELQWWSAHFRTEQARCLMVMNRYTEAEPMLQEAYKVLDARLGEKHRRTQNCIRALRDLYAATLQPELAGQWDKRLRPEGCQGDS